MPLRLFRCVMLLGIVERVCRNEAPFYRPIPTQEDAEMNPELVALMKQCWAEQPSDRPSFDGVLKALKAINKGK